MKLYHVIEIKDGVVIDIASFSCNPSEVEAKESALRLLYAKAVDNGADIAKMKRMKRTYHEFGNQRVSLEISHI